MSVVAYINVTTPDGELVGRVTVNREDIEPHPITRTFTDENISRWVREGIDVEEIVDAVRYAHFGPTRKPE
jgi:hypothetical protein